MVAMIWQALRTKVRLRTRIRARLRWVLGRGGVVNEHFVPGGGMTLESYLARGDRNAVHHLIRYRWAEAAIAELGPVDRVLDVACGSGYGSHGIATRFAGTEVVGADYDADAIELARSRYAAPNLDFVWADVTRWDDSLGAEAFDCIVCFDTIEHVAHREIMFQNVVEHLRPEGMLLLSTPVRSEDILEPTWEHHEIEYSPRSLYDFLSRYFGEVLAPDLEGIPCAEVFAEINRSEQIYALRMNPVVCRRPIRVAFPGLLSEDFPDMA